MKHWMLGMVSVVLLHGCSTSDTALQQDFQQAQQRLALLQTPHTETGAVRYDTELYVPPLAPAVADLPSWSAQSVQVTAQGLRADSLLQQVLAPHGVRASFLQPALAEQAIHLSFTGSLAELLQQIAQRQRWHLEWHNDRLLVYEFEMAEFDVAFIAGNTRYLMGSREQEQQQAGMFNEQLMAGAGTPQRSDQYLSFSHDHLSVWDDLEHALQLLLSPAGRLTVNQSSASVLVRDYPDHVAQVRRYLAQQNERLTRQVAIDVQILEVTFNDSQQFAIDWDAVLRTAGGEGILGIHSAQFTTGGGSQLIWQQQQGRAQGSQVLLDALAEQGLVEVSNQPRIVSLNNQIARIVLEDNATYLAAAGSAATANVGRADMLQPGVVTTGFELYVLPSIQGDEVILQLSTELSDLERIDEVRSGTQMIQTPHTNRKKFFMKALVEHQQTLLLSGLKNERRAQSRQTSWLSLMLGGREHTQQRHSETIVLLTPYIIRRGGAV
ncbi:type IVB pilus formation outer membrane protein, R64 PilN family [Pseudidiomarina indica]|uniref:Type IVB pilus formation outer membrane protein, R64 PilN family n=1 Tax=Pseudidiomarina indica TaxID=1159017 RepID=A0A1G6DNV5_9GAMM|nr:hypothetical protein [Pseudidiomarina indica]SDB46877.1 type IVB pilus formation outer membrane protein, R64 PilN family [Pseudidiomarina indica]